MHVRAYRETDEDAVVELWRECGLLRPWNDPHLDIARKLTEQPDLFLVAVDGETLVGTAMAGFDGHRGWINYLAVALSHRRQSIGRMLMSTAEALLIERGCPKLNLQIRSTNKDVIEFYRKLGYQQDEVISMGRRLIVDNGSNNA